MKKRFKSALGFAFALISISASAQLYDSPKDISIVEDQSGLSSYGMSVGVVVTELVDGYLYRIGAGVHASGPDGRFHQSDPSTVSFSDGSLIGPESPLYSHPNGIGSGSVALGSYTWRVRYPGNVIFLQPGNEYFPNQTEILLGFSRGHPGPVQYGWIRMRRDVTRAQDIIGPDGKERFYVFQPVDYAIHPIAEQPIRAGMVPEFPNLSSVVETGEDGSTMIRIGWPAGWNGMRLETTYALEDPTVWTPVLDVTGNEAVFPLPEDGELYFRLNYVP